MVTRPRRAESSATGRDAYEIAARQEKAPVFTHSQYDASACVFFLPTLKTGLVLSSGETEVKKRMGLSSSFIGIRPEFFVLLR